MTRIGQFGIPGATPAVFTEAREIFWGGDASRIEILQVQSQIDAASVDAGAAITTTLRGGLLLGKITSSGKLKQWDATASDGSEILHSVNREELTTRDAFDSTTDRFAPTVVKAPLKAKALLIKGVALIGHADEFAARHALALMGCKLDDDPQGFLAGINQRTAIKTATGAIVASENGTLFYVNGSGAVTLTLPAIKAGLRYEFLNIADQNVTIASAAGDDIIVLNDLQADSITYSTTSQKIGARVSLVARYVNGNLRWVGNAQLATATLAT